MKKTFILLLLILIVLSFAGCTSSNAPASSSVQTGTDSAKEDVATVVEKTGTSDDATQKPDDKKSKESSSVNTNSNVGNATKNDTKTYSVPSSFSIEGKWKSVGEYGFGQAQPGAIVVFDGTNCNFFSPKDTYAFYKENNQYKLDCTSFMSTDTLSFKVKIVDSNNIDILYGDKITKLKKVQ